MDSFLKKVESLASKISDKLEEQAEASAEKNRAHRERINAIMEDMIAEEELLKRFNEKMGVSPELPGNDVASLSSAHDELIQKHLPGIVRALKDRIGPSLVAMATDPERLSNFAQAAYQALPLPVRLIIKEQEFVEWVLSHQDKVIECIGNQAATISADSPDSAALPPAEG